MSLVPKNIKNAMNKNLKSHKSSNKVLDSNGEYHDNNNLVEKKLRSQAIDANKDQIRNMKQIIGEMHDLQNANAFNDKSFVKRACHYYRVKLAKSKELLKIAKNM